jgi:hypothetical protein
MRDFAEIRGNASDHATDSFSLWWTKIRSGLFEFEDSAQN